MEEILGVKINNTLLMCAKLLLFSTYIMILYSRNPSGLKVKYFAKRKF